MFETRIFFLAFLHQNCQPRMLLIDIQNPKLMGGMRFIAMVQPISAKLLRQLCDIAVLRGAVFAGESLELAGTCIVSCLDMICLGV